MHRSSPLTRMVTTQCGMRRILKQQPSPLQYIKWATETGIHKDLPANQPRSRQPKGRGRQQQQNRPKVHPYPIEYEILSMVPPLHTISPDGPHALSAKQRRALNAKNKLPTEKYMESYMQRYDARRKGMRPITDAEREEYYYRKTLGISKSKRLDTAMGRKASVLNDAYEFAMRQCQVIDEHNRKNASGNGVGQRKLGKKKMMTEEDSIRIVEELLAKEAREESTRVRANAETIVNEATPMKKDKDLPSSSASSDELPSTETVTPSHTPELTIPSILHSKPRTIQALHIWGKRLQAVPYPQWTLGASTALDHWIAIDVLGMSEESWNSVLNGELESDVDMSRGTGELSEGGAAGETIQGWSGSALSVGNRSKARDIVSVRSTLFPETVIDAALDDFEEYGDDSMEEGDIEGTDGQGGTAEQKKEYMEATERSIDQLLASLGGFEDEEDAEGEKDGVVDASSGSEVNEDEAVRKMIDSLQEWRQKNQEMDYKQWSTNTKNEFNDWLSSYIALVTNENDGQVDLRATREALLSDPPLYQEESNKFWSKLENEADAEVLLHNLLNKEGSADDDSNVDESSQKALEIFKSLPYSKQLNRILNLGTLRPILDEYTLESQRLQFMKKYGDLLLEGVEMEHLVPDLENGTIGLSDVEDQSLLLEEDMKLKDADGGEARFSIKMIKYGTDEFGTTKSERARELYRAWSMQKAGKARYEEHMYKIGKRPLKK